jgi:hypothetical protein
MAQQENRQAGMVRGDAPVQEPEITPAFFPAPARGQKAKIGWANGSAPVTAKVAGINGIAGPVQGGGEAAVAPGVFPQSMDDLYDAPGRDFREPTMDKKLHAIRGRKKKRSHRKGGKALA